MAFLIILTIFSGIFIKRKLGLKMQVYKYRSNYDFALKLLSRNKVYAPNKHQLNDPFEGIVTAKIYDEYKRLKSDLSSVEYERKINLINKLYIQIGYIGIYSMSKTFQNELLWSYYANSHKGFCIEYESSEMILEKSKSIIFPKIIEIDYKKNPPIYSLKGMDNIDYDQFLTMLIGTKSYPWKHEDEIRLLFNENGEQEISNTSIKSIIFGARASKEDINNTIKIMSNKIRYYKMRIKKRI